MMGKINEIKSEAPAGDYFGRFAAGASNWLGSKIAFVMAGMLIVVWGITGPIFHFSDTWQLVINTGTTIITFLMVFLIQNTQNRDARVFQIKLDELIRATEGARHGLVNLEEFTDADLLHLQQQFHNLRVRYGNTAAEELLAIEEELSRRDLPITDQPKLG